MATANTLTEAEIGNKVAAVAAGHKMAGFNVTDADREAGRAIIAGELDADTEVARLVAEAKVANATPAKTPDNPKPIANPSLTEGDCAHQTRSSAIFGSDDTITGVASEPNLHPWPGQ